MLIDPARGAGATDHPPTVLTAESLWPDRYQCAGASEGGRPVSEALRLKVGSGTIKLDAEIDATDDMEAGDHVRSGKPEFLRSSRRLETLLYPSTGQLTTNHTLSSLGTLGLPMETALPLFVFGQHRHPGAVD